MACLLTAQEGDIGTILTLTIKDGDIVLDISGATLLQSIVDRPSPGSTLIVAGALVTDGKDGKFKYITVANDLSPSGIHAIQGKITLPSGTWNTKSVSFEVLANIS